MKKTTLKITGLLLATAVTAFTARADIALTQNLSTYGYAAGFLEYNKIGGDNGANSSTDTGLRAAKLGFAANADSLTARVSLYDDGSKLYLLEVNGTYDLGEGLSVTGGRFQSWLGYEPFDIPKGNFITNGNEIAGLIPNFHEGVRVDYAVGKSTFGVAFVDSIYNGVHPYSGDGSLNDGYGLEGHYGYDDGALSLGATFAYQNNHGATRIYAHDIYDGDLWAQYIIKKTTVGAEVYWQHTEDQGPKGNAYYGLFMVKQQFTDPLAVALRFTTGNVNQDNNGVTTGKASYWKFSIAPTYAITENLGVTAEVHYTEYSGNREVIAAGGKGSNTYLGIQACFKF